MTGFSGSMRVSRRGRVTWVAVALALLVMVSPLGIAGCSCAVEEEPAPVAPDEPGQPSGETGEPEWYEQESGTSVQLNDVYFIDEATGWAVGGDDGGVILSTSDGGQTWTQRYAREAGVLYGVFFLDAETGWAVGDDMAVATGETGVANVLRTTDGGETWRSSDTNTLRRVEDVYFVDASTGYCVAWASQVFKSTDGGATWQQLEHDFPSPSDHFIAVNFTDADTGWVAGGVNKVMATSDGGRTWVLLDLGGDNIFPAGVQFLGADTGWVAGSGGIAATTDAGRTWVVQDTAHYNAVHFVDAENGWAVGGGGRISATTDGGTTWLEVRGSTAGGPALHGVHFPDTENGWAVGDEGSVLRFGIRP